MGHIARNVAGLTGLVAPGTAILGAARAPLLPVVWTVLVLRHARRWVSRPPGRRTGGAHLDSAALETRTATVAAVVLAPGTVAHAVLGSRR